MLRTVTSTIPKNIVQIYDPGPTDSEQTPFLVKDLSRGAQLAVWSIRKWVLQRRRQASDATLIKTYELAGIASAAESLDEFMTLLSTIAMRPVTIECACSKTLTGDELLILRTLRSLQAGQHEAARLSIARLVNGHLGNVFCRSAEIYTKKLSRANLSLNHITKLSVA